MSPAGGITPPLTASQIEAIGYKIVIFPVVCWWAALQAMDRALSRLAETGTDWHDDVTIKVMDAFRLVGFDWWHEIEERSATQ